MSSSKIAQTTAPPRDMISTLPAEMLSLICENLFDPDTCLSVSSGYRSGPDRNRHIRYRYDFTVGLFHVNKALNNAATANLLRLHDLCVISYPGVGMHLAEVPFVNMNQRGITDLLERKQCVMHVAIDPPWRSWHGYSNDRRARSRPSQQILVLGRDMEMACETLQLQLMAKFPFSRMLEESDVDLDTTFPWQLARRHDLNRKSATLRVKLFPPQGRKATAAHEEKLLMPLRVITVPGLEIQGSGIKFQKPLFTALVEQMGPNIVSLDAVWWSILASLCDIAYRMSKLIAANDERGALDLAELAKDAFDAHPAVYMAALSENGGLPKEDEAEPLARITVVMMDIHATAMKLLLRRHKLERASELAFRDAPLLFEMFAMASQVVPQALLTPIDGFYHHVELERFMQICQFFDQSRPISRDFAWREFNVLGRLYKSIVEAMPTRQDLREDFHFITGGDGSDERQWRPDEAALQTLRSGENLGSILDRFSFVKADVMEMVVDQAAYTFGVPDAMYGWLDTSADDR